MKNIILIITDTFRYDNAGDRAQRPVRTPCLDRFAKTRATAVEKCFLGSFPTIPQRTDLATGVIGWPHYGWQPLPLSGPNHIASILAQAGYCTQLVCDTPHLFKSLFQLAFHGALQHRGQEGDVPFLHLHDPIENVVPVGKTRHRPRILGHTLADMHRWGNRYATCEADMFPAKTAETSVRWLEENYRASPFFLWVDFFDPHEPWDPPEYMVKHYDPDYEGAPMLHPNYGPSSDYTDRELHNLWAHYAAESEMVDRWIGRILQKIDDLQLWEDTIVVVLSDHGISIGEHERTGKSNIHPTDARYWPIYPEVSRSMLLIAGGGIPRGETRDIIVQPCDLLPTMCELAGVSPDPPRPFDGRSFAACLTGGVTKHREYAVSASHVNPKEAVPPPKHATPFVVNHAWGYVPVGPEGGPELYAIADDPLAADNVIHDHGSVADDMHALLLEHLSMQHASRELIALWQRP